MSKIGPMTLQTLLLLSIVSSDRGCLPPTMESSEQEVSLTNKHRTIECPLRPFPLTEIMWRYARTSQDSNDVSDLTMDGRNLTINNKNISGYFVCFVDNECGREMSTGITVTWTNSWKDIPIQRSPFIVINAGNVGKCVWYIQRWKDSLSPITEVLEATSLEDRILSVGNRLYVKYLMKNDDFLKLMCLNVVEVFTFLLMGKPELTGPKRLKPQFPGGRVIKVTKKETVLVPCIYVGGDYNTVSYFFEDKLISNNSLPITIDRDDFNQTFTCVPFLNGTLLARYREPFSVIYHEIPVFGDSLTSVNITRGENASFTCEAAGGFPHLEISFHVENRPVGNNSDMSVLKDGKSRSTLKVFNASRSMAVRCRLRTDYAQVDKMVYLKIMESPSVHINRHYLGISQVNNPLITCQGNIDPLRILSFDLLLDNERLNSTEHFISRRGKTITVQFTPNFLAGMEESQSMLTCVVSDGFSSVNTSASLTFRNMHHPFTPFRPILWIPIVVVIVLVVVVVSLFFTKLSCRKYVGRDEVIPFVPRSLRNIVRTRQTEESHNFSHHSDSLLDEDMESLLHNQY